MLYNVLMSIASLEYVFYHNDIFISRLNENCIQKHQKPGSISHYSLLLPAVKRFSIAIVYKSNQTDYFHIHYFQYC